MYAIALRMCAVRVRAKEGLDACAYMADVRKEYFGAEQLDDLLFLLRAHTGDHSVGRKRDDPTIFNV